MLPKKHKSWTPSQTTSLEQSFSDWYAFVFTSIPKTDNLPLMTIGSDYQVVFDLLLPHLPKEKEFNFPTISQYLDRDKIPDENFIAYAATNTAGNDYRFYQDLFDYLYSEGLVVPVDENKYKLSEQGKKAKELGGFAEFEKYRINKLIKEDLEFQSLKTNLQNAIRIDKTYWLTFGMSVAAFLISLVLLVLKLIG